MKMYNCPDYILHRYQHELFIKKSNELKEKFFKEDPLLRFTYDYF
jgi:hypothetical protein